MFLEDFTCIAIIDFELHYVNKTPPRTLSRKEQQRSPVKILKSTICYFLGNYKHLNRVKNNATDIEILHKCT